MGVLILGGGLAGCSLAYFLDSNSVILEKEARLGGLCRSYQLNNIIYDIGPHALFSKNKEVLSQITSLTETNVLRRSNKIYHKNRLVKYPFENDLAALAETERDYCLKEFLNNPYEVYHPHNMLQFFLKTFGEGITKLYLQPYNEKIWKFDAAFMDTQMVERIPKPPKDDVIQSARGIPTEGYTHQLYFHYPCEGGIEQLITALAKRIASKTTIVNPVGIRTIECNNKCWTVETDQGIFTGETLINCMPLHEFCTYIKIPQKVQTALNNLKYNSIHIIVLQARKDNMGDNFAFYVPERNIIFHRISKMNFLGKNYCLKDKGSTIMAEITYRPGSYLADLSRDEIRRTVIDDFDKIDLVKKNDVFDSEVRTFQYAYVIYDLDHRKNTDTVLSYLANQKIFCCGRFAEFEYLNMDAVFEHSYALAQKLNEEL